MSEPVNSVHPLALLPLHRHANTVRQALSHLRPMLHALTCLCVVPALAPHALVHCVVPLGRRVYFPVPMRLAISNLRPHMIVPELISVPSPFQRACPAIRLAVSLGLLGSVSHACPFPLLVPIQPDPCPRRPTSPLRNASLQSIAGFLFLRATCLYSFLQERP
jgi:hypothetical protein